MKIIFIDESELTCNEITFSGNDLIADGYRIIPIDEIEKIETI